MLAASLVPLDSSTVDCIKYQYWMDGSYRQLRSIAQDMEAGTEAIYGKWRKTLL
jgi:hypothetical protein